MTDTQKQEILNLKNKGNGCRKIAALLSLPENTVKSFLRRGVNQKEKKRLCKTVIKNWRLFQSIEQRYFAAIIAG